MFRSHSRYFGLSLLLVLLLPRPSSAQQVGFTPALVDTKFASLSKDDCTQNPQDTTNFAFTWSYTPTCVGGEEEVFLSTSSSCADTTTGTPPVALILRGKAVPTSSGGTVTGKYPTDGSNETLDAQMLFSLAAGTPTTSPDASVCTAKEVSATVYLCVEVFPPAGCLVSTASFGQVPITVDSTPPPAPTLTQVSPLDSALLVSWTMPSDLGGASHYQVNATANGKTTTSTIDGASTTSAKIQGLTNGTTYSVTVQSLDDAGTQTSFNNVSADSNELSGTPQEAIDFYTRYRSDGGQEKGGCASAPMSLLALLIAGLLLWKKRTRLAVLVLCLALPALGRAQDFAAPPTFHSPQSFTVALRLGPYSPSIDSEPALKGKTPYKDIFGTQTPLMWRVGLDYDVFKKFGRLSVGLSLGFWQALGKGRSKSTDQPTGDTILLNLWPLTPSVAYRFDVPWVRYGVPLVPFARFGYGFTKWSSSKNGQTSTFGGDSASGWARGIEYAVGVELVLDAFDPQQAVELDQDSGINSTRLFFDFEGMSWRGAGGLRLDGTSFGGGLALAF